MRLRLLAVALTYGVAIASVGRYPLWATLSWLLSLGLFLRSTRLLRPTLPPLQHAVIGPVLEAQTVRVVFLGVLMLAVGFRVHDLSDIPSFIHNDEAMFHADAVWRTHAPRVDLPFASMPDGWFPHLFGVGWNGFPALATFLHWTPVLAFGPGTWSLRIGSALVGIATIGVVFVWVKRWWGNAAAVIAALALAVSDEHVYWSRMALNNVDVAFVGAWALAALARALDTGRADAWASLGCALGFGFHTYHGAKVHLMVIALVIISSWRSLARRFDTRTIACGVGAFVLVVGPLVPEIWRHWPEWLAAHSGRFDWDNFRAALDSGDPQRAAAFFRHHYYETWNLFSSMPVWSALVLAGGVIALIGWRDIRYRTVLLWAGSIVALGSFTHGWRSARLVGALPVFAVLAAFPILHGVALSQQLLTRVRSSLWMQSLPALLGVVGLGVLLHEGWVATFVQRAQIRNATYGYCRLLERMPLPATIFVMGELPGTTFEHAQWTCMIPHHPERSIVPIAAGERVADRVPQDRSVVVVVGAGRADELARLASLGPNAVTAFFDRGVALFHVVWLKAPSGAFSL